MSEVYAAIRQLEESFPVSVLCQSLNVSRSAYYAWRQDGACARQRDDNRLRPMIRGIFREHRRRYGRGGSRWNWRPGTSRAAGVASVG